MHVVGNSYGAIVTLTLLTERPDLVVTAAVHEPPLFGHFHAARDLYERAGQPYCAQRSLRLGSITPA